MLLVDFAFGSNQNWGLTRALPRTTRFHCANCYLIYDEPDDAVWCASCRGSVHFERCAVKLLTDRGEQYVCLDCAGVD